VRDRRGRVHARAAGRERVHARGRRCLSHVFRVFARSGQCLGDVSVARPRTERPQRGWRSLVAPTRRVAQALSEVASVAAQPRNKKCTKSKRSRSAWNKKRQSLPKKAQKFIRLRNSDSP